MIPAFSAAVADLPQVGSHVVGIGGTSFTWAAVFGLLQTILLGALGGGGVWGAIKIIPALRKIGADHEVALRTIDEKEDSSLRTDLMGMVSDLRKEVVEERVRCAAEIAAIEKRHLQEVSELRGEIQGLHRQLLQISSSMGRMVTLPPNAPTSAGIADRLDELSKAAGQT